MRRLGDTVARLTAASLTAARLTAAHVPAARMPGTRASSAASRLRRVDPGGLNPGALDAFAYAPPQASGAALVVVLHGCTQTAEAYDHGSGWSRHAEALGFAVLFPEQRRTNNPGLCFNWFTEGDVARDRGEAASIAEMIVAMVRDHDLDPKRVFITGLSAGGAMVAAMLATYPDLFAGGAVIAGLPFAAATGMTQAFDAMRGSGQAPAAVSIERVRQASPGVDRWPRVSIFHGTADSTVDVRNSDGLVAQWVGVHGLKANADSETVAGRCRHRIWSDAAGSAVVEDYRIEGMGHGVPIDAGGRDPFGAAGPFMLDVGFSSTACLIEAWDLGDPALSRSANEDRTVVADPAPPSPDDRAPTPRANSPAGRVEAIIEASLRRAGLLTW